MTALSDVETPLYSRWVSARTISCLGTNDGAPPIAFQNWQKFKESFPPELIFKAITESPVHVQTILDPFSGSGTTSLSAQILGRDSLAIEVNPYLADLARAKLYPYDPDEVAHSLHRLTHSVRTAHYRAQDVYAILPPTFLASRSGGRRTVFDEGAANEIASIMHHISQLPDEDIGRLFRVLLGGILVDVSNVVVNGKGRRYRTRPRRYEEWDTLRRFYQAVNAALHDISSFYGRGPHTTNSVITADARSTSLPDGHYDLAVFSPPYPNSFDYTDIYNIELWMLKYLSSYEDNRRLRLSTLHSHVQLARQDAQPPAGSPKLDYSINQLNAARPHLWSKRIPEMIGGYFADLLDVLDVVRVALREGSEAWLVIGDSMYHNIPVPVAEILVELTDSRGWDLQSIDPIRHMRTSAQHGGSRQLAETLLVLRK